MEQLLERINKAPLGVKVGSLAALIVLITAACYLLLISDAEEKISALKNQQTSLDKQLAEKKEIADNLNERRREMDLLDQKLQDALIELPEDKDIDELLAQLNDIGKKSGLEIGKVVPGTEKPEAFFARIPISMTVSGNYHEVAMFMQEVSNMRRIVNVNNIKLDSPSMRGDKVLIKADFLATTFRFIQPKAKGAAGAKGGAK